MFYEGDLQNAIATAVQEAKFVICFVRDDEKESKQWESEYFDDDIAPLLRHYTVILRLTAGSQEANFLTSFCPINAFPTLVVIKNGMLQEYIVPGTSKIDFHSRLKTILETSTSNITVPSEISSTPTGDAVNNSTDSNSVETLPVVVTSSNSHSGPDVHTEQEPNDAERKRRDSIRSGKKRADFIEDANKDKSKLDHERWREQQRKLQRREKEERERVRNLIKKDHDERRRKGDLESLSTPITSNPNSTAVQPNLSSPFSTTEVQQYRLQIRLFDGSSVRSSFAPSATIHSDVRPWLDKQRSDGNQPYNLKHVLTPRPSHSISIVEEGQTLGELGLGPTANLVMVPIKSYTDAYTSPVSGLPFQALSSVYDLVSSVVGAVTRTIGSYLGYGAGQVASDEMTSVENPSKQDSKSRWSTGPGGVNIRTLRDQRTEQDDTQFYNGNQLNFEPRKDDDGKND